MIFLASQLKKCFFSVYSHNIRSLHGNHSNLLDTLSNCLPHKFSIVALQEVWSCHNIQDIPGYSKIEFNSRDKNTIPNPKCGGGVAFYIDNKFNYEILSFENQFKCGIYESIWTNVDFGGGKGKIIGNIYRPNTAPMAD